MDDELALKSPEVFAVARTGGATALTITKLGEELPIFCEKCGYSLHGAPQIRCERCDILQFHCPECGHHQPINTLRPAFQRMLGRVRAGWLVLWVLIKLVVFVWALCGWVALGYDVSRQLEGHPQTYPYSQPLDFSWEMTVGTGCCALAFGAIGRLLLLRWRRGVFVGLVLAALAMAALIVGVAAHHNEAAVESLWLGVNGNVLVLIAFAGVVITGGAAIVWWIWMAIVTLLLPRKTGAALLDWQRSLSARTPVVKKE